MSGRALLPAVCTAAALLAAQPVAAADPRCKDWAAGQELAPGDTVFIDYGIGLKKGELIPGTAILLGKHIFGDFRFSSKSDPKDKRLTTEVSAVAAHSGSMVGREIDWLISAGELGNVFFLRVGGYADFYPKGVSEPKRVQSGRIMGYSRRLSFEYSLPKTLHCRRDGGIEHLVDAATAPAAPPAERGGEMASGRPGPEWKPPPEAPVTGEGAGLEGEDYLTRLKDDLSLGTAATGDDGAELGSALERFTTLPDSTGGDSIRDAFAGKGRDGHPAGEAGTLAGAVGTAGTAASDPLDETPYPLSRPPEICRLVGAPLRLFGTLPGGGGPVLAGVRADTATHVALYFQPGEGLAFAEPLAFDLGASAGGLLALSVPGPAPVPLEGGADTGGNVLPVRFDGLAAAPRALTPEEESALPSLDIRIVGDPRAVADADLERLAPSLEGAGVYRVRLLWNDVLADGAIAPAESFGSVAELAAAAERRAAATAVVDLSAQLRFASFLKNFTALMTSEPSSAVLWIKGSYLVPLNTPAMLNGFLVKVGEHGLIPRLPRGEPYEWLHVVSASMPSRSAEALITAAFERIGRRTGRVWVADPTSGIVLEDIAPLEAFLARVGQRIVAGAGGEAPPDPAALAEETLHIDALAAFGSLGVLLAQEEALPLARDIDRTLTLFDALEAAGRIDAGTSAMGGFDAKRFALALFSYRSNREGGVARYRIGPDTTPTALKRRLLPYLRPPASVGVGADAVSAERLGIYRHHLGKLRSVALEIAVRTECSHFYVTRGQLGLAPLIDPR